MAELKKGLGPVKRFGVRYGRTPKYKLAQIEVEQKARQKCPFCSRLKVRRIAYGIWHCKKCSNTFSAGAYTVSKKLIEAEASPEKAKRAVSVARAEEASEAEGV